MTYKKVFIEHFENQKIPQRIEDFEESYLQAVKTRDISSDVVENAQSFKLLLSRSELEQIDILDRMSKIFDAVKDNLVQCSYEKLEIPKVSGVI